MKPEPNGDQHCHKVEFYDIEWPFDTKIEVIMDKFEFYTFSGEKIETEKEKTVEINLRFTQENDE